MTVGETSAARTGIVEPLIPMPIPKTARTAMSACHEWVNAIPIGVAMRTMMSHGPGNREGSLIAAMKIAPRRPNHRFNHSDDAQPL